jgi:lactobin A/cerein 7B family class IIb bacteriocin
MNTLDLQALGLEEMNEVQMMDVDGGIIPLAAIVAIWGIQAAIDIGLITAYATLKANGKI